MLHMILLVLKFIGIAIASVIGLLFLLLILVLFVPIRYRIAVKYYEEPEADVKIGWLFRAIYLRVRYLECKPDIKLRILGLLFMDSTKEKKENPRREERKRKREERTRKKEERKNRERKSKEKADTQKKQDSPKQENARLEDKKTSSLAEDGNVNAEKQLTIRNNEASVRGDRESKSSSDKDNTESPPHEDKKKTSNNGQNTDKKESPIGKVIRFVKSIPERIRKIKTSFKNIGETIRKLFSKIGRIKEFIFDENNKLGFVGAFRYLLKYIKHFAPVKFHTYIHFGTGDPCLTGQILGIAAAVAPIYHESIRIVPDFEKAVIEGEIDAKGRIRFLTLLIITLKVLFDKDLRGLKDSLFKLKEEL